MKEQGGKGAAVVLPTYDGEVQLMATLWDACPVRTTAHSSMSKLCSKSVGKNLGMLIKFLLLNTSTVDCA